IDGNTVQVTREVDGGLETVEMDLPAIISTDLRLNTPRHASLPNVMKARQKPLEEIEAASLGVTLEPTLKIVSTLPPPARKPGSKVGSVADLIDKLRNEARVI